MNNSIPLYQIFYLVFMMALIALGDRNLRIGICLAAFVSLIISSFLALNK